MPTVQSPPIVLHVWWSAALKNRGDGRVIAIGANADEARVAARQAFLAHLKDEDRYMRTDDGGFYDEDDERAYQERLAAFEADIAKQATIVDALCIPGTD